MNRLFNIAVLAVALSCTTLSFVAALA